MKKLIFLPLLKLVVVLGMFFGDATSAQSVNCNRTIVGTGSPADYVQIRAYLRKGCPRISLAGAFGDGTAEKLIIQRKVEIRGVSLPTISQGRDLVTRAPAVRQPILRNLSIALHANRNAIDKVVIRGLTFSGHNGSHVIRIGTNASRYRVTNTTIFGNKFINVCQSRSRPCTVIWVFAKPAAPDPGILLNHSGTRIQNNYVWRWGAPGRINQAVKIGNQRLSTNGLYMARPQISGTLVRANYFFATPNQIADDSDQRFNDTVQTYEPAVIRNNHIRGSYDGVSLKGNDSLVLFNDFTEIYGDAAIYVRDGVRNRVISNWVQGNGIKSTGGRAERFTAGFWLQSSSHTILRNNLFVDNERAGAIYAADHPGSRTSDPNLAWSWNVSQTPNATVADTKGETSYHFTTSEALFVNNTFERNEGGIFWNGLGSLTSCTSGNPCQKTMNIGFVKNRFVGDDDFEHSQHLLWWGSSQLPCAPGSCGPIPDADRIEAGDRGVFLYDNEVRGPFVVSYANRTDLTVLMPNSAIVNTSQIARITNWPGERASHIRNVRIFGSHGSTLRQRRFTPRRGPGLKNGWRFVKTGVANTSGFVVYDPGQQKQWVSADCAAQITYATGQARVLTQWVTFSNFASYTPYLASCAAVIAAIKSS